MARVATLEEVAGAVETAWREGRGVWVECEQLAPLAPRVFAPRAAASGRLYFGPGRPSWIDRAVSGVLQLGLSLVVLLLGAPLWLPIAVAIRLTSRGPVLYRGARTGRDGRTFSCFKFRSMRLGSPPADFLHARRAQIRGQAPAHRPGEPLADPRITGLGRALRAGGLDEVPQFWHVLTGDMRVVGPRPYIVEETEAFLPWHQLRHRATPGITGLWQVNGRSAVTFDESVILDLYYIANRSIWMDLRLMLLTPLRMLRGMGGASWPRTDPINRRA